MQVKWLPFILHPELPREGVDKRTYHRQKMGQARADALLENIKNVGATFSRSWNTKTKTNCNCDPQPKERTWA